MSNNPSKRPTILRQVRYGEVSVDGRDYSHPCFADMENVTIALAWRDGGLHVVLPDASAEDGEKWVELAPATRQNLEPKEGFSRAFVDGLIADRVSRSLAFLAPQAQTRQNPEALDQDAKADRPESASTHQDGGPAAKPEPCCALEADAQTASQAF